MPPGVMKPPFGEGVLAGGLVGTKFHALPRPWLNIKNAMPALAQVYDSSCSCPTRFDLVIVVTGMGQEHSFPVGEM